MQWSLGGRAWRAARRISRPGVLLAALCAMALAACTQDGQPGLAGQPRGATVAFESIDGPPPGQFRELVQALNNEAQTRRLAVISRESPSTYRVRGYLAAKVTKRETTISWVWDVFDRDDRRALRIAGEETCEGPAPRRLVRRRRRDAAPDRPQQHGPARRLPDLARGRAGTPDAEPRMVLAGARDFTPESAGIFRLFQPNADPAPSETAQPAAAGPVPLPPRRPPVATTISARETLTLAASSH